MKSKIEKIKISGIRSFTGLFKDDPDMLYLTIGEPDLDTPDLIKEAAKKALDDNLTHYPPALGILPLRERIATYENKAFNDSLNADHVIVTNGATEGLVLAMWTLLEKGDAIILPTPGYTLYQSQALLGDAVVKTLDTVDNNFQIDEAKLRSLVDENTKAILLTSPNNPSGDILNKESLDAVYAVMKDHPNLYAILDDVYNGFVYDGDLLSLRNYPDIKDRLIVVQAFSKSHAMTGWRIGYVLANPSLIDEMHKLHQNLMAGVNSITQYATIKAFDVDTSYMKEDYKKRRDYVYDRLIKMGLTVNKPKGAFYIFPNIKEFNMTSYDFAYRCAQEFKLALIPGIYFGADDYVRLSYCYAMDDLKLALDRLESYIESLR
ncbi:MAG TPA: aminotransferase class I/II-fold pyridoxal phosphate-dependent enzyme [Erysipelothrix sp.]|nr:aminotransferase class I/II-fold pyridoxal phosphate-dependent enzyme [Erysipelothrix sp.]